MKPASLEIKGATYLALLVLLVLFWGFYRTYLMFFPAFENFVFAQHFHGIIMLLWMGLLIVQPLLIQQQKAKMHKALGTLTYIVAPLLVVSIFMVARMGFLRGIASGAGEADATAGLSLSIPLLIAFILFYFLAIVNKSNTHAHMRYMIGTAFLMLGPGLGRAFLVYFKMEFGAAVLVVNSIIIGLAATFLLFDIRRKKDYRANTIVTLSLICTTLAWEFRYGFVWQGLGGVVARMFE